MTPDWPDHDSGASRVTVVDWGVGGVGLLKMLRQSRPQWALRYRSDSGYRPWGTVPTRQLRDRLSALIEQEQRLGADAVLIACNAASTVIGLLDRQRLRCGVHGVIVPGLARLTQSDWSHFGIVGGRRTIRSGAWARPLRLAGRQVTQRVAQPLSARIELGDVDSEATRALIARICGPLASCDAVVLACTHYPAASAGFAAALPTTVLVDPATAALDALLAAQPSPTPDAAAATAPIAVTTGDAIMTRQAAQSAFGLDLGVVRAIPMTTP